MVRMSARLIVQRPGTGRGRELGMEPATRYNRGMSEATLPLPPELRATAPASVVAAGEAAVQGPAAPVLLPPRQGS